MHIVYVTQLAVMNKLIIANWKMNGTRASARALAERAASHRAAGQTILCPPFPLLGTVAEILLGTAARLGAQDCHHEARGAFTGDVSADMLQETGCAYVIAGHSERRRHHGETDALIRDKIRAIHRAGITAIFCLGESLPDREAGKTLEVIGGQLAAGLPETANASNTLIAYEPVWAIGSGFTPSAAEIEAAHTHLAGLSGLKILYGGSVSAENTAALLAVPGVSGALVGGASLNADAFSVILDAAANV